MNLLQKIWHRLFPSKPQPEKEIPPIALMIYKYLLRENEEIEAAYGTIPFEEWQKLNDTNIWNLVFFKELILRYFDEKPRISVMGKHGYIKRGGVFSDE